MLIDKLQTGREAGFSAVGVAPAEHDRLAAAADRRHGFLRHAWYAAAPEPATETLGLRSADGRLLAAIPLGIRRAGPFSLKEVAGGYWPFRSLPIAADTGVDELAATLCDTPVRSALGPLWRLGPVHRGDPVVEVLVPAARRTGWTVLERHLGSCFELDLAGLRAGGDWPRSSTLRKNRWRKRRLAESGDVECRFATGAEWTAADRDAMAEVEANSWLAKLDDGGDTKFRDPARRRFWEALAADPAIADMLFCAIMTVGGKPAAFTFGIEAGDTRYYVANNYDEHLGKFGPGKLLLYDDFERAAERGIARISWGAGDAGYKAEMGAAPGPDILDLLFVRHRALAPLARRLWCKAP